jgi:hypothetical protein
LPPGTGNIADDPQLSSRLRLLADSPCIDAGSVLPGIVNDLVGIPRPLDGNNDGVALPDMGAYEFVNFSADSDHDGLTDVQEMAVLGTSPVNSHSDDDPVSDYQETIADTDPLDGTDWFRITGLIGTSIAFPTSANRYYTLQCCSNLAEGSWSNVPGQINVQGSGGIDTLSDSAIKTSCFYRVQVRLP